MTASDLIENFEKMDLRDVAATSMRKTSVKYLDRNRLQMLEGKGRTKPIGKYRSKEYAQFKASQNPMAGLGNVDLRLTGSFQDKMTFDITGDEIDVSSSDGKLEDLTKKYGEQIFGLNPGTKDEYIENDLQPEFERTVEAITGLKFG